MNLASVFRSRPQTAGNKLPIGAAAGAELLVDGRIYDDFASSSYFGLHRHPAVIAAASEGLRKYGFHPETLRPGFGDIATLREVEQRAATLAGREQAYYFGSSYAAGHVLVQAIGQAVGAVFIEEDAHIHLREAARMAGVPVHAFRARDAGDLRARIAAHLPPGAPPLVLSQGVVPATGEVPPLADYLSVLAEVAPAILIVEDSHGLGVLGERGRGALEYLGLDEGANGGGHADRSGVSILCGGSLAYAMGGFGGIVTGSPEFLAPVREAALGHDRTDFPPPALAAASAKALQLIDADRGRLREDLQRNSTHLRRGLRQLGLDVRDVPSAQIGVKIGTPANLGRLHQELRAAGFLVSLDSRDPKGGHPSLLRFAVCSRHTLQTIDNLLRTLCMIL